MKYKLIGPVICSPENTMQVDKCPQLFTVSSYVFEYKSVFRSTTQSDKRAIIKEYIENAFKSGINFFHISGPQYEAEAMEIFSESVQSFLDKIVISSTCDLTRPANKIEEVLQICEQLRTNCIDILYLDCNNDACGDVTPAMLVFRQLLNSGKINGAGLSNASLEQIECANKIFPLTIVRSDYHSLSENMFDRKIIKLCKDFGIIFSVHTDFNEEFHLFDQDRVVERIAEKYCFSTKQVMSIWMISQGFMQCIDVAEASSLSDYISALKEELSSEELKQLTSVFESIDTSQYRHGSKPGGY